MNSLSLPLLPSLPFSTIPSQLSPSSTRRSTRRRAQVNTSTTIASSTIEAKLEEKREAFTSRLLHLASQREAEENPLLLQSQLQRRMNEVKSKERAREVEKVMHDLVLHRFMEAGQTLMIMPSVDAGEAMLKLERHKLKPLLKRICLSSCSEEEVEAIEEDHLNRTIGGDGNRIRVGAGMIKRNAKIVEKVRVGRVYAASIMYGYFLKRVNDRYALERSLSLRRSFQEEEKEKEKEIVAGADEFGLRSYIDGMDDPRRLAMMRSNESIAVIESRCQRLFGKERGEAILMLRISHLGLERMLLEALLFGAFLFQAEAFVDCYYTICTHEHNQHGRLF